MRLTEEQVFEGLQHADRDVREAVLRYFADSYTMNPAVMPAVIELAERLGRNAFQFWSPICDLPQSEATIEWALRTVQASSGDEEDDFFLNGLRSLLCEADPRLLSPHREAILAAPGIDPRSAERLERRIALLDAPADELWRRLEAICEAGKSQQYPEGIPYSEAEDLTEALARDALQAPRMLAGLSTPVDQNVDSQWLWLEIFLVRMAGEMRCEAAVPLLIEKFLADGEILNEECSRALRKIGGETTLRAVNVRFPQAPRHFRLFSCSLFGDIHSDEALAAGLERLAQETDPDVRIWLAVALAEQFSTDTVEAGRAVLRELNPRFTDLKLSLVAACKLLNYDVPELEDWKRELAAPPRPLLDFMPDDDGLGDDDYEEDEDEDDAFDDDAFEERPIVLSPKIGRNDACPCGSGKKFKKCCYGKETFNRTDTGPPSSPVAALPRSSGPKYPVGTVALYGPDDKSTTKIVAAVIKREDAVPILKRFVGTNVKQDPKVRRQIAEFFKKHHVKQVAAVEENMGCPHEEGPDFPHGEDCPFCPYWAGKQGSNRRE